MDLKNKALTIFSLLLIFSIVGSIAVATAQDTLYPLLALSSNELTFYAKEYGDSSKIDLTLVGLAAGNGVNVRIVASKLYDNSSEEVISNLEISDSDTDFDLKQNDNRTIMITLNPSTTKAGTYQGVLIITATNKTASAEILTKNIVITAKIEAAFWYKSIDVQLIFVIGAIAPIFVGLLIPDKDIPWKKSKRYFKYKDWLPENKYSKKFWLIVLGAISVAFWLASIVSLSFTEIGTIINTVLVTPFLTYVISFVKDKRTERLEQEKASRTIQNSGIEKDIELLRKIMGEISTHCASFNPHLYQKEVELAAHDYSMGKHQTKSYDYCSRILFNKSGIISRKVWDDSRKQGLVADLPLLELEKYYDFTEFYNLYYSRALELLTKDEKKDIKPSDIEIEKFDFDNFQAFREAYADLESVLFAFLSYVLGHLSKTYLSPLKTEFRRISRTLLKKLVDYEILDPKDYEEKINTFIKKYYTEFEFVDEYGRLLSTEDWNRLVANLTLAEKFKLKINKYDLSAADLEDIMEKTYESENVERFYRRVSAEFKWRYIELKKECNYLKPKIKDEPTPEKKHVEMSGQLAVLKGKEVSDAQSAAKSAENSAKQAEDAAKKAKNSARKAKNAASRITKVKRKPAAKP